MQSSNIVGHSEKKTKQILGFFYLVHATLPTWWWQWPSDVYLNHYDVEEQDSVDNDDSDDVNEDEDEDGHSDNNVLWRE